MFGFLIPANTDKALDNGNLISELSINLRKLKKSAQKVLKRQNNKINYSTRVCLVTFTNSDISLILADPAQTDTV